MNVAPKIVSGLVVKIFNCFVSKFFVFEWISKFISQPRDFPIQFFALT